MSAPQPQSNTAAYAYDADQSVDRDEYNSRWDKIWLEGVEPGQAFDIEQPNKAMVALIQTDQGFNVKGKRVFIPGCGRGYDVEAFIKAGAAEVDGLEVSTTAVAAATKYLTEALGGVEKGRVLEGDFFKHCEVTDAGGAGVAAYDIGYDYTFGCAMHPSIRTEWASSWAKSILPGGELVAVIFPIDGTMDPAKGPPFPINLELYKTLLEPVGFECIFSEHIDPSLSHPKRQGREMLTRWKKKA